MDTIDRRRFLQLGLAGAAATVSLPGGALLRAQEGPGFQVVRQPTPPDSCGEFAETGVDELRQGLEQERWSSEEIVESLLKRIEALDRSGPALNAVVEVNPAAREEARQCDAERRAGRVKGPLHGIPVLLKDNIDTAGPLRTTAGSLALLDAPAARDAFLVRRLREAGVVVLGKTNLSEWANFRSSHSSSGWSARGGQTRNPYALDRSPCGSSSGSGAAVAAGLAPLAVGTETDGSITCPSSVNGVVGLKPTVGLVSRAGIVPISHSQDTAGPMARTVRDAALLLDALAGFDPGDAGAARFPGEKAPVFADGLAPDALKGARLGVARNFFGFHEGVDALMETALDALRRAGATLVDPADVPHADDYGEAELVVLLYEFKHDLNEYLATRPGLPCRTLEDLIAFNERHREAEMPFFGQDLFGKAQAKGPLTSAAYRAALGKCRRLSRAGGIDAALRKHSLQALVAPTGGPAWPIDHVNGDHFMGGCTSPAAVAGYPHVTVPAGYVSGLPVGLSFFGTAFSEKTLLNLAFSFETLTRARRPPRFLPTLSPSAFPGRG